VRLGTEAVRRAVRVGAEGGELVLRPLVSERITSAAES
jgi:hypothetical protein